MYWLTSILAYMSLEPAYTWHQPWKQMVDRQTVGREKFNFEGTTVNRKNGQEKRKNGQ